MGDFQINKLEELLGTSDKRIIERKIKCLTAPGDNYGSLMLSLDLIVDTPEGETEKVNIVAKMLPLNEEMQELFNCQVTFRNEIAFYQTIMPALRGFQREHGVQEVIDFIPKYFGSRWNLNGSSTFDRDAVLLLENLKVKNFVTLERTEGYDFDISKLVITDLAYLHAVSLALKLQKPKVFETDVKPYLVSFNLSEEILEDSKSNFFKLIHSIDELKPFLERLEKVNFNVYPPPPPREPFATICHNDCWVNNTMIQLEAGRPIKSKIVDFQLCDYGSPAKDVLFFLFSSVKNQVLSQRYDDLIQLYYAKFISVLKELKCETEPFSFEAFQRELEYEAKHTQFVHTLLMLHPIFAPKGSIADFKELKPSDIGSSEPTDLHKEKATFIIKQFATRNWI